MQPSEHVLMWMKRMAFVTLVNDILRIRIKYGFLSLTNNSDY